LVGLTSSANGRNPGLPFYILGGPRGHVQLHDSAGKAIGELVANGALPLSIIDMADFKPGGLQRFFSDFAPALMKRMRGVVYLVRGGARNRPEGANGHRCRKHGDSLRQATGDRGPIQGHPSHDRDAADASAA
jgi:hypothetical protein